MAGLKISQRKQESRILNTVLRKFGNNRSKRLHYARGLLGGARWPHGWCARLRIKRSGFEAWPESLCCVLGQDTLLSQY